MQKLKPRIDYYLHTILAELEKIPGVIIQDPGEGTWIFVALSLMTRIDRTKPFKDKNKGSAVITIAELSLPNKFCRILFHDNETVTAQLMKSLHEWKWTVLDDSHPKH